MQGQLRSLLPDIVSIEYRPLPIILKQTLWREGINLLKTACLSWQLMGMVIGLIIFMLYYGQIA